MFPKEGSLTGSIYPWQATYDSAVLEMDLTQMPDRVTEALKAIFYGQVRPHRFPAGKGDARLQAADLYFHT